MLAYTHISVHVHIDRHIDLDRWMDGWIGEWMPNHPTNFISFLWLCNKFLDKKLFRKLISEIKFA